MSFNVGRPKRENVHPPRGPKRYGQDTVEDIYEYDFVNKEKIMKIEVEEPPLVKAVQKKKTVAQSSGKPRGRPKLVKAASTREVKNKVVPSASKGRKVAAKSKESIPTTKAGGGRQGKGKGKSIAPIPTNKNVNSKMVSSKSHKKKVSVASLDAFDEEEEIDIDIVEEGQAYSRVQVRCLEIACAVNRCPQGWAEKYGAIVWARANAHLGFWPAYVYDPREMFIINNPVLHKPNQVGSRHIVYFFGLEESAKEDTSRTKWLDSLFGQVAQSNIVLWEEGKKRDLCKYSPKEKFPEETWMLAISEAEHASQQPIEDRLNWRRLKGNFNDWPERYGGITRSLCNPERARMIPRYSREYMLKHEDDRWPDEQVPPVYKRNIFIENVQNRLLTESYGTGPVLDDAVKSGFLQLPKLRVIDENADTKRVWYCISCQTENDERNPSCTSCEGSRIATLRAAEAETETKDLDSENSGRSSITSSTSRITTEKPGIFRVRFLTEKTGHTRVGSDYQVDIAMLPPCDPNYRNTVVGQQDYARFNGYLGDPIQVPLWIAQGPEGCNFNDKVGDKKKGKRRGNTEGRKLS